tara:strand:+ start:924 stop:1754 length:831 start_codon:yes stop_codon:yes gene_type:complete
MIQKKIGFMQGRLSEIVNNKIQCFPWENWENEFVEASKINLNLMEWTLDYEKIFSNPILTDKGQKKIKNLKENFNLEIVSVTGDCFMQKPFWKFSDNGKIKLENEFKKIIDTLKYMDIKIIVVPLVDNGSIKNNDQFKKLCDFFLNIEDILNKNNQKIAFESDKNPFEINNFFKILNSKVFGVNYDIGNSASLGYNPKEEFDYYGDKIINVHIKDRLLNGTTVPLGSGNASFDIVFSLLDQIKYSGNYILQTARSQNGQHTQVLKEYYEFTKKFLK